MAFNLEQFLFNTPIYTKVAINEQDLDSSDFDALFNTYNDINIEGYNPMRKVDSTFKITRTLTYSNSVIKSSGGYSTLHLSCKRYNDLSMFYILYEPENFLMKIGQYPTVADFHIGEIKQYKNVISDEKLREFTRAIGLAANGVGIGSFVYLRRIFEFLINEAYSKAKADGVVLEADYQRARMDEKIDLLHSYLPSFLVENKAMYSILSLGIHELNEQTCLAHFDTLRVGIEIILDEKLDEQKKKDKIEEAKKKLASLKGEIKK